MIHLDLFEARRLDGNEFELTLPLDAEPLSAGVRVTPKPVQTRDSTHDVTLVVWALADRSRPLTTRRVVVAGTGAELHEPGLEFLDRVEVPTVGFLHVFTRPTLTMHQ